MDGECFIIPYFKPRRACSALKVPAAAEAEKMRGEGKQRGGGIDTNKSYI